MTKELRVGRLSDLRQVSFRLGLVVTSMMLLAMPLPAMAQTNTPTETVASNVSPAAISLILLVIGLVAIGVVALRGIEPTMVPGRPTNRQTPSETDLLEDDALVEDIPAAKLE